MSHKIFIQTDRENPRNIIELPPVKSDITNPTFGSIGYENQRLNDAINLLKSSSNYIQNTVNTPNSPNLVFIYRGVAVGGINKKLDGFSSKPIDVKYKSINPLLIDKDNDLKRLSGSVPISKQLSKGGESGSIVLDPNQKEYFICKIDSIDNSKNYLFWDSNSHTFSWENNLLGKDRQLCSFLGDSSSPYLADWDLVNIGVTKRSLRDDKKEVFEIKNNPKPGVELSILPNWLEHTIGQQSVPLSRHVIQHGPESLYGKNIINDLSENFLVVYGNSKNQDFIIVDHDGINNPFNMLQEKLDENFKEDYIWYEYSGFNGTGKGYPNDYSEFISNFNMALYKQEKVEQVNRLGNSGAQAYGTGNPEHSPEKRSNSQEISLGRFTISMNSRRSSPESTDTTVERTGVIPKQSSSRETLSNGQSSNRKF